jgi:Ca2+-dependent lipid-binding protein
MLDGEEVGRTSVKKNQLNPVWTDEVIQFDLPHTLSSRAYSCAVTFEVYDHDKLGGHEFLGLLNIGPEELQNVGGGGQQETYQLEVRAGAKKAENKYVKGELTIELSIEG